MTTRHPEVYVGHQSTLPLVRIQGERLHQNLSLPDEDQRQQMLGKWADGGEVDIC
jgi:hypothetical protein